MAGWLSWSPLEVGTRYISGSACLFMRGAHVVLLWMGFIVPFMNITLTASMAANCESQMLAGTSLSAVVKNWMASFILYSDVICGCFRYICKYSAVSVIINALVFPSIACIHLLCCRAGPTLNSSHPLWYQYFPLLDVLLIIILQPRGPKGVAL